MSEMEPKETGKRGECPGCGRHCDLEAPHCPRGEAYARTGELPPRAERGHGEWEGSRQEGAGKRGECPGCGRHCDLEAPHCPRGEAYARTGELPPQREHGEPGPRPHGPHGGHRHPPEEADDTAGQLLGEFRALEHLLRGHRDGRGGQSGVLSLLAQGPMTQRELTQRMGIQAGSASELLGKLEAAGLITRKESSEDRRTTDVALTEAGQARAQTENDGRPQRRQALFSALEPAEQETLLELLRKLRADWEQRLPQEPHPGHGPRGGHHGREH